MLFHTGPVYTRPIGHVAMPGGFLAVDLFFALSGFVLAHSYLDRLRAGLTMRQFMTRRLVRLWPMVLVGATLSIVLHGGHAGMLFLLPDWRSPQMFPTNPPYWSLLAELLVNVLFAALLARWARSWVIVIVILPVAAAMIALGIGSGIPLADTGVNWASFPFGMARTVFSFGIGVALYLHWQRSGASGTRSARALLPLVGTVAVFALLTRNDSWAGLLAIVLLVPLATWAAARWELPWRRPAAWLGDMSYPLYCIHMPLLALYPAASGWALAALCLTLVITAWLLERLVDLPARRLLARLAQHNEARADARRQTRIGIRT